jgi:hypothetical protein
MSLADNPAFGEQVRRSARPRKNPWSLLSFLFSLVGVAGVWIGIALLFQAYRRLLLPSDAFLSSGTRVGNIPHVRPACFPLDFFRLLGR